MEYGELIKDYLDDAEGHLGAFDNGLLSLESTGHDSSLVVSILGSLHTLKGNSGMMGFQSLKTYIHHIEEILKKVSEEGLELEKVLDSLLHSANVIRNTLQAIGSTGGLAPDLTDEILKLQDNGKTLGAGRRVSDISVYLGAKTDTIRVDFKRLDDLLNLAGEMLICKTRLNRIEALVSSDKENRPLARELRDGLESMGRTVAGLQEGIMRVRMLPVRHVFQKFRRMVRDLAKAQDKEIALVLRGEDTEIDKTIVDELEEPVMHLIRNAVDHGIESPRERIASGKDRQGVITLSAVQESNYVSIEVRDDGRGLNPEEIREAAVRKGLVDPAEMLDRSAALGLIFSPGFTTKKEATDISGRGIGLDVVSKNIVKLNGHVSVESAGEGTAFTLKLPLSLAIITALMAEAAGETYAIPMSAVSESVKVDPREIHVINNHEVIRFREKVLPVVRLGEVFGLEKKENGRLYLVVIGKAEKSIALAVDRLRGKQEIVIKPLDETFGKSYGISGASILGDGRIVLIVDVMTFLRDKH